MAFAPIAYSPSPAVEPPLAGNPLVVIVRPDPTGRKFAVNRRIDAVLGRRLFGFALVGLSSCGSGTPPTAPSNPTVSLIGTVAAQGGAKLPGATVRIGDGVNAGKSTTTNDSGEYRFDGLAAGNGNVSAVADGYESVFLGLRGNGQTLHFHATDDALGDAGEWRVTRPAGGVIWQHAHGQSDVAVRGPAADLLLVLNRRWSPTRLEVLGDAALFEHWLENSKF